MKPVTFDDIRAFAVDELWQLPGPISEQTALEQDFGVAGQDGKEFMEKFAVRFSVDLGEFDWVEYFGPEVGATPWGWVAYWFRRDVLGIPARELVDLPEISLAHLVKCANQGRWEAPASALARRPDPA